jgi:hypothetical protein
MSGPTTNALSIAPVTRPVSACRVLRQQVRAIGVR